MIQTLDTFFLNEEKKIIGNEWKQKNDEVLCLLHFQELNLVY